MNYYKLVYNYIDSINKIVNKEQEYRIFIDNDGTKYFECHFYICFPFYDIFPMYDCSLKINDLKEIIDLERDMLYTAIDIDRLYNKFNITKPKQ